MHPRRGSGANPVALGDDKHALEGLPARRGRARTAAAQQCCCSPTARHRRFRVSAASLGISSIAQEAREAPPRRSTSSSTLDGHVVAVASPAGGFVAPVLHEHRFAPDHCPACTFGTPLGARRTVVFAGNELSVQESDTKVGGSHELVYGITADTRH